MTPLLAEPAHRWSAERAQAWYDAQPYRVGTTYIPSSARHQLDMWMDPMDWTTIKRELGWAKQILGFNAIRVSLHDLMWKYETTQFFHKVDQFLDVAHQNGMATVLVVLDSVGNAVPKYAKSSNQHSFTADDASSQIDIDGLHGYKSSWLQSPGIAILKSEPEQYALLQPYIQAVVNRYGRDHRVLMLDLWNEPFALSSSFPHHGGTDKSHTEKQNYVARLLPKVMEWARGVGEIQVPLTVGVTKGTNYQNSMAWNYLLKESDILTFHNLQSADKLLQEINGLRTQQRYGQNHPIVCLEFLARTKGSTFEPHLQTLIDQKIWAFSSGLVKGKAHFFIPPGRPVKQEPTLWYQDILNPDGTPHNQNEVDYISNLLLYNGTKPTTTIPPTTTPTTITPTTITPTSTISSPPAETSPSAIKNPSLQNTTVHDIVHAGDVDDDYEEDDDFSVIDESSDTTTTTATATATISTDTNTDINTNTIRGSNNADITSTTPTTPVPSPHNNIDNSTYNRIWFDLDSFVAIFSSLTILVIAFLARRRIQKHRTLIATAAKRVIEGRDHSMRFDMDFEDDSVDENGASILDYNHNNNNSSHDVSTSNYAMDLSD